MRTRFLVAGAGLAGAAAAWRLAEQGQEVVVVEADRPATAAGSSHGSARIFRHAYPDSMHAHLTLRALDGWRELEAVSGESLLTTTGGLDFGSRRDLDGIEAALADLGVDHERLSAADAMRRWPHLRLDTEVVHHAGAGVVDAERAVGAMVRLAQERDARVLTGWAVAALEETDSGVRATSAAGEVIECEVLVLAVGAWLPELLPLLPGDIADLIPPLEVTQQQAFHFRFPDGTTDDPDWPIFVDKDELNVYSLPGGRDAGFAGFKIAEHDGGQPTTASRRDGVVVASARERIVDYVRHRFPTVDPSPYAETTCLYTSTPSEDFLIDRRRAFVIASPCSGHGAKFAPVLGDLIAGLATGSGDVPAAFRFAAHASTAAGSAPVGVQGSLE